MECQPYPVLHLDALCTWLGGWVGGFLLREAMECQPYPVLHLDALCTYLAR